MRSDAPSDKPSDPELARKPGKRSADDLIERVRALERKGVAREQDRRKKGEQAPPDASAIALVPSVASDRLHAQRGQPLEARLRAASRELMNFGAEGAFKSIALNAQNEFPTPLTRLPIFRPSQRRAQQAIQDLDNAVAFETPFGSGRRLGPPLTTRDEDTLMALMRLRSRRLKGCHAHLPVNVRDIYSDRSDTTEVHRVVCTIQQVNGELDLTDSGTNFRNTMASIKRLGACSIELDRILVDGSRVGGPFNLLRVQWRTYNRHGLVDVVFLPLIAHWLNESYTYIDWKIRKQLSPLGKAIHRYFSGQRTSYTIELGKLAAIIGYDGRRQHMKRFFSAACDELVTCGWVRAFSFRGNGRSTPFMITIVKARKPGTSELSTDQEGPV